MTNFTTQTAPSYFLTHQKHRERQLPRAPKSFHDIINRARDGEAQSSGEAFVELLQGGLACFAEAPIMDGNPSRTPHCRNFQTPN